MKEVFPTEAAFQAWLSSREAEAGVDLLVQSTEAGSAVDTSAPGFDLADTSTWCAHAVVPRGNAVVCKRRLHCHCHGTSAVKSAAEPGQCEQDTFLANFGAATGKKRWVPSMCLAYPRHCLPAVIAALLLSWLLLCPVPALHEINVRLFQ